MFASEYCDKCGEEPSFALHECEECGDALCEYCYGELALVICRTCEEGK